MTARSAVKSTSIHHKTARPFSSTATRTPVRRHSSGAHGQSRRPSFLRPLSSLAPVTLATPPSSSTLNKTPSLTKVNAAEAVHRQLASSRRGIASSNVSRIEQTPVVEAEGDMATTQDHVVIDVSEVLREQRAIASWARHSSCFIAARTDCVFIAYSLLHFSSLPSPAQSLQSRPSIHPSNPPQSQSDVKLLRNTRVLLGCNCRLLGIPY